MTRLDWILFGNMSEDHIPSSSFGQPNHFLSPQKLIQVACQLIWADTLHPLQFGLDSVPVGLNVLSKDPCDTVDKLN